MRRKQLCFVLVLCVVFSAVLVDHDVVQAEIPIGVEGSMMGFYGGQICPPDHPQAATDSFYYKSMVEGGGNYDWTGDVANVRYPYVSSLRSVAEQC